MDEELRESVKAEFGRTIGTISLLIASKQAIEKSMPAGPDKDLVGDEIITLDAIRNRQRALLNRLLENSEPQPVQEISDN